MNTNMAVDQRWYQGITRYQWIVLTIASLGWIFDIFEGQVFVASMKEAMPSLLPEGTSGRTAEAFENIAMAAFLVGGALGGVVFGMISDRVGRKRAMVLSIMVYSLFTCVTAFSQTWWHMTTFRFLVALGTGGEWAVATALVAEVFPKRARARSLGIFHASSTLGTYVAVLAGIFIVANPRLGWRWAFVLGGLPALLTIWIAWSLHEPEKWIEAREAARKGQAQKPGRLTDLFKPGILRNSLVGISLATIGLATFWGVYVYGQQTLRQAAIRNYTQQVSEDAEEPKQVQLKDLPDAAKQSAKRWEMLGLFLACTGGGIGLLAFGPICERIGRRRTFLLFHLGGLAAALLLFQVLATSSAGVLCVALPIFGFLTLGLHAGYAIYFPELFPTRLRGTGAGFCFNGGRFLAASILILRAWMCSDTGLGLSVENTASLLSLLFLLGLIALLFAPETKGRELPT